MRTVILDDDPTGTQSASGAAVLLDWSDEIIEDTLREEESVYILTNTRSMSEGSAVTLLEQVRDQSLRAGSRLGEDISFVLRGDSTLRGHVFAETEVFARPESILAFVPAFPAGGRVTRNGVHYVRHEERFVPADETEYAQDPVFPFDTAVLSDFIGQRSSRDVCVIRLAEVRDPMRLQAKLAEVTEGTVVTFDAETDDDILVIAESLRHWRDGGRDVVVRSAAPLAAELAGVRSSTLLASPLSRRPGATLVVCGSHTEGARRQLEPVIAEFGQPALIDTHLALSDPTAAAKAAGVELSAALEAGRLGFLTTERNRRDAHNTLDHGRRVMTALTGAVENAAGNVTALVSKGGITSAEVARVGLGASRARVRGQLLPGVSVWDLTSDHGDVVYIVVPGNVGEDNTIVRVLDSLGMGRGERS